MIAVIGSGPAGVSTALYLKRANKDVIVFTNHKSSLVKAKSIDNYYGTGSISGIDLYNQGIDSLNRLNIKVVEEEVFNISFEDNFILETNQNNYNVDVIVLATGSSKNKPSIKNLNIYEGNGVSYCATCDGYFFKDKKIAVLGSGDFAIHELKYLKNITNDLVLFTNGEDFHSDEFVTYNEKVIELLGHKDEFGNEHLDGIKTEKDTFNIDALFIALDHPDSNILAKKCGIITNDNIIIVNESFETNIPNIYACGDAVTGQKQIAKAVYEGMITASNIITSINKKQ